jgi:Spy/CpxP family protein refolding chaperone
MTRMELKVEVSAEATPGKSFVTAASHGAFGRMSAMTALDSTSNIQTSNSMKKILIILLIAATTIPAPAVPKPVGIGEGLGSEAFRSSVRELVQTAMRNFLNFRKETPIGEEQRQKIGAILGAHRAEIRGLITRGREARRACAVGAKAQGPDGAETREAAEAIGRVARDRALLMAKLGSEVRPLLTAAQQKHLESARGEFEDLVDQALATEVE